MKNQRRKVISFSLWGDNPSYIEGAIRVVQQARTFYPGWEIYFYVDKGVKGSVLEILERSVDRLILMESPQTYSGAFWRFLPASDPDLDVLICRDVDTMILSREVYAVNEWIESEFPFHIMRDHPSHESPIMAGMWGCRGGEIEDIETMIAEWGEKDKYGTDQKMLEKTIYPRFRDRALIHSECVVYPNEKVKNFPTERLELEYVGSAERGEEMINKNKVGLSEWLENGSPYRHLPTPWSVRGRLRLYTLILKNKFKTLCFWSKTASE